MKVAIVDIGTNSFKLMIARVRSGEGFTVLHKEKIAVKLGEGGINNDVIAHAPFQRGIKALKKHAETIERFEVDKTIAFATSAIRSATNGKDFIRKAKAETEIDIEVISGDLEATLIYEGVRNALEIGDEKVLIMDIGGGSTEFIIGDGNKIYWKHSFDLGAARLLEEINPSEPITKSEIKKLRAHLKTQLSLLWGACEVYKPSTLIGSSGSFDSLAEMIYYRYNTEENPLLKTEYHFNFDHFYDLYDVLIESTIEKRFKMKGLAAMRVEMIVVAVIMVKYVIKKLKIKTMRLSSYSLKEGMLFDYLRRAAPALPKKK